MYSPDKGTAGLIVCIVDSAGFSCTNGVTAFPVLAWANVSFVGVSKLRRTVGIVSAVYIASFITVPLLTDMFQSTGPLQFSHAFILIDFTCSVFIAGSLLK